MDSRWGASRSAMDRCLVSPCGCSGTQKWVHVGCLRQWQRVSVSSSGAVQKKCMVCHQKFRTPRRDGGLFIAVVQPERHRPPLRIQARVVADAHQHRHGARGDPAHRRPGSARASCRRRRASHMGRARDSRRKRSPPRYSKTREVVHQRALRRSHHVAGQSRRRLSRGCARAPRRSHGSDHTRA